MNNQEFFNITVQKLIEQGQPSLSSDEISCAYRGTEGTKCAIGFHVLDEEYEAEPYEDIGVGSALQINCWPSLNELSQKVDVNLMSAMQCAHDGTGMFQVPNNPAYFDFGDYDRPARYSTDWVSDFKARAKIVAEAWGLQHEL